MGDFNLQVGDLVTMRKQSEPKVVEMVGRLNVWFQNDPIAYTLSALRRGLKEVHRPTSEGMVKVWPLDKS